MLDYHVHLWPHAERATASEQRLEQLAAYCERAASRGVNEIALTEHLFRFTAVRGIVGSFWDDEPDRALADQMAAYFAHHATADFDTYVESVLAAKAAGLPVLLGLEVDYYPGQMDRVAEFLAGYPFDVLIGSVHWLGTWMFDNLEDQVAMARWEERGAADAWREYTRCLEELAATRAVDVLAHPDLVKVTGRFPDAVLLEECESRMAEAAAHAGLAAEVSSAGLRKPVKEIYPSASLLAAFAKREVPITTASDTHGLANLAEASDTLADFVREAGYSSLCAFSARQPRAVSL